MMEYGRVERVLSSKLRRAPPAAAPIGKVADNPSFSSLWEGEEDEPTARYRRRRALAGVTCVPALKCI